MGSRRDTYRGNLAAERVRRGLRRADVARQLAVSVNSVNNWERGLSTPSTESLLALMGLFEVDDPSYLLEKTGRSELRAQ